MKDLRLVIYTFLFALFSSTSYAQSGIHESYVIVDSGSGNTFYDLNATTVNVDFNGADLGNIECGGSLLLNGAQNKIYKCDTDDILNGFLNYRIYPALTLPPVFTGVSLPFLSNDAPTGQCILNERNQTWQESSLNLNIANGLAVGSYVIEVYNSADFVFTSGGGGSGTHFANNAAANYIATFSIVDTTAPVITLTGANPQVLETCSSYVELGATISDCETGLSVIIDASVVDMSTPGTYNVTYNVTDTAINAATEVIRTVTVQDTTAPVINLTGVNPQVLETCSAYVELGATINDCEAGLSVTIDASAVDMSTPGSYNVTYNVTDTAGNAATEVTRTVTVQDTTAAVITLTGVNPQVLETCSAYVELGATINDCEAGLSVTIDASAVDMSTPGSYNVTYNVTDTAGNAATEVTRTVTVQDTTAAVITLTGVNPQVLETCSSYVELGATVSDCETGLTVTIDASAVDMSTPGSYNITYNVTDTAGNAATQVTRVVTVQDTTAPVITLTGSNPQVLETCSSYVELGATVGDCETGLTVTIDASAVDMSTPGSYNVTYNVTDTAGNAATEVTRTVTVQDTTAAVITLTGVNPQVLETCSAYVELGATINDCEAGLSVTIDASAVDMNTPGSYNITYNVTDTAGNAATEVTRTVTVQDTTAAVITLTGVNPQVLETCSSYVELGATVSDCETGLTVTIDASAVDMSTPGSYNITYNVTDTAGNAATQVTRVVTVQDTTAPVITLTGSNPQVLETCSSYVELGATVGDCETGLTVTIDASAVDMSTPGTYNVTYNVTDTAGNVATEVIRTVIVQDTTAPVINLTGSNPQVLETCSSYVELGATISDCETGLSVTIDASVVDMSTPGTYNVTYNVTDTAGNAATQVTRVVTVQDTTAPVITLIGTNPQVLEACSSYVELGATISDCEAGLSVTIDASAVDMSTPGSYNVTYNVTDTASNAAIEVIRTVTVQDTTAPVITLTGANPQVLETCSTYVELGATIADCETGLSVTIDASAVDMSTPGTYNVTYNVTDTAGNAATEVTRTVTVQDTTAAVITLTGVNPQVLETCSTYVELGATVNDCETGLTVTIDASAVDMSTPGTYNVTYNVTDTAGNAATQVIRTVTVQDTTNPTAPSLPTITGECSATVPIPSIVDNCSGSISGTTSDPLVYNSQGAYAITWTFDDGNGNSITAVQNVLVDDTMDPVAVCQDLTIQLDDTTGTATITGAQVNNGSSDNCGTVNFNLSQSVFDCTDIGPNIIVFTVDDGNGNTDTCTTTITVTSPNITGGTALGYLNNSLTSDQTTESDLVEVTACPDEPQNVILNLTGHTGSVAYWESSTDGGVNWTAIVNTTTTYFFANVLETTLVRAIVQIGSCQASSSLLESSLFRQTYHQQLLVRIHSICV